MHRYSCEYLIYHCSQVWILLFSYRYGAVLFHLTFNFTVFSRTTVNYRLLEPDFVVTYSDTQRCRYLCNADASLFLVNADCSLFANADCSKVINLFTVLRKKQCKLIIPLFSYHAFSSLSTLIFV
jgi:hypothetical protein